jgi:hypothetical protein
VVGRTLGTKLALNCTSGAIALEALTAAGGDNVAGKMVDSAIVPGEHDVFICGDDECAKRQVRHRVRARARDVRGVWVRLADAFGTRLNIHVAR